MDTIRANVFVSSLIVLSGCASMGETGPFDVSIEQTIHPLIETHLQKMTREEHFSGVALVMQDGQTIHASGYGQATIDRANGVDTAFHIASVTKQFTAAAIMQLVERDVVSLHDSINRYLPAAFSSEAWNGVTIHHLLSHTSGVEDYAISRDYYEIENGFVSEKSVDHMIAEAMAKDLEIPPGSRYAYSNLGYTLLGEIIEYQSKISYANYIQTNILEPMGMVSSRIRPDVYTAEENEATGYRWSEDRASFVADTVETLPATLPDAGLITTLGDLARWSQIFLGGDQDVISQESISAMTSQHIQMGRGGSVDAYGYGLGVGERLLAHSGHVVGFRSQFILDRQTGTVILVFSNSSAVNMERIAFEILTVLFAPES